MICCSKKNVVSGIAVAIWAWAFDFLWHGNFLMDKYLAYQNLWRPMPEMETMWPWCIAFHLVMGFLVASAYNCWRAKVTVGAVGSSECPYRKSLGFGLWVGLLLGVPQLMVHMWLPIDVDLPLMWMVGEVVKWTLAGILLNKLYGKI